MILDYLLALAIALAVGVLLFHLMSGESFFMDDEEDKK
jgi:hypothetical protein